MQSAVILLQFVITLVATGALCAANIATFGSDHSSVTRRSGFLPFINDCDPCQPTITSLVNLSLSCLTLISDSLSLLLFLPHMHQHKKHSLPLHPPCAHARPLKHIPKNHPRPTN